MASLSWRETLGKVDRHENLLSKTEKWKQGTPEGRQSMKERYKYIMQEVDMGCDSFVSQFNIPLENGEMPRFQFMDVCCCPGGFSEYFLLAVPHAKGVGLSLPVELGGHILSPETMNFKTMKNEPSILVNNKERYTIYFRDITTIASTLTAADFWKPGSNAVNGVDTVTPADQAEPIMRNNFTHMILDGSFLGGKANIYMETKYRTDLENPTFNVYNDHVEGHQALLAAQLAIMAANLQEGGHVVLRMSMTWTHFTNGVLVLLRRIFRGSVQNYKPRSCHQGQISYYLVCRDFDLGLATKLKVGPRFAELTQRLRAGQRSRSDNLVPFPELPEGRSTVEMYRLWAKALQAVIAPPKEPVQFTKPLPCWMKLVFKDLPDFGCKMGIACSGAHSQRELHPFTKVAFNQVNGHLYKPIFLDPGDPRFGMLRPGQGHPRNEHKEVQKLVVEWNLHAKFEQAMPGVSDPHVCANSPLHQQVRIIATIAGLQMAEEVWGHLVRQLRTTSLKHWRPHEWGGYANSSDLQGFHAQDMMHALLGPDAPLPLHLHSPREPMPMQPPVLQPPLPVHVGHVFGGLHGATVGSAMQGLVHAGYGGGRDAQGGADGGGLGGGMAGLELDPEMADAVLVGSDEQWSSGQGTIEGDTFGTEVYKGDEEDLSAMKLSGYSIPLLSVEVADEHSHAAMLQYLGE